MDQNYWRGRKVLVTGAGGFIGSHLAEQLARLGADTRCFVHYNSKNSAGWLDRSSRKSELDLFAGDIRDIESVRRAVQGVDVVFHLAALIGIPYSYHSPRSYVQTNVEGTLNILEAARHHATERIICTSTSEVYGTAQYVPIDEKHPLTGQSPYSATKIGADKIAEAYHLSFGMPVSVARPFNTYGPRQSTRAVIPTIISQALLGETIRLGNLDATRDLNFVEDTVQGFLALAATPETIGQTINFATGQEISIRQLAIKICDLIGKPCRIESEAARLRPRDSEVERLCGSSEPMRKATGWEPKVSLQEGLTRTIDWMKHENPYTDLAYTI